MIPPNGQAAHLIESGSEALRTALDGYSHRALVEMLDTLRIHHGAHAARAEVLAFATSFLGTAEHAVLLSRLLSPRLAAAIAATPFRTGNATPRALKVRLAVLGGSPTSLAAELRDLLLCGAIVFTERPSAKEMISLSENVIGTDRHDRLAIATFPAVLDVVAPHAGRARALDWRARAPARVRSGEFLGIQRDVYLALRAALEDRLRMTARGLPFKHDVARIIAQPSATSGSRGRTPRRATATEPTPRLWFALSLLLASPGVTVVESRLVATPEGRSFLAAPRHAQASFLLDAYRECVHSEFYRIPDLDVDYNTVPEVAWVDPTITSFGYSDTPTWPRLKAARAVILSALADGAREEGAWLAVSALATTIRADHPDFLIPRHSNQSSTYWRAQPKSRFYEGIRRRGPARHDGLLRRGEHWDEVEGAHIQRTLVEPLHWLGLLDLGFDSDEETRVTAVRLTSLGRHLLLGEPAPADVQPSADAPSLVVQPNYDAIVLDAAASLDLLSRLDDFAERTSLDRAATYRLTRESVVRGFERGLSGAAIVATLERAAGTPLPQNVGYSIAEWARLYERVHVREAATLLVADSVSQLDGWLADADLGALLGSRLSPTAVLVPRQHRQALHERLRQARPKPRVFDYGLPRRQAFVVRDPGVVELDPKKAEPYLRYRVGAFADPTDSPSSIERAGAGPLVYRIGAESIARALAAGVKVDAITSFLNQGAIGPLPPDTLLRVRGWGGAYAPPRHASVVAVELTLGLSWSALRQIPEVERALVRVASPTIGLIDPSEFASLRTALAERGIDLAPGLGSAEPASGARSRPTDAAGYPDNLITALQRLIDGPRGNAEPDPSAEIGLIIARAVVDGLGEDER